MGKQKRQAFVTDQHCTSRVQVWWFSIYIYTYKTIVLPLHLSVLTPHGWTHEFCESVINFYIPETKALSLIFLPLLLSSIWPRSSPHYFTASYYLLQYIFITFLHLNLDHTLIYNSFNLMFFLIPTISHEATCEQHYLSLSTATIYSIIAQYNLIKMGNLDG